ncbi:RimJ/RimL family protein N-acetyltransferase [Saccharomonospora amisosensis]|uniref:RimJ/RimL family protein N-acetyltransferase n=1 Tax=Saccharomonospora amisosensis TaxID=1128677 RepID=A0A7X5UL06_9PSEU|nr:GNAT family N-acetyltransferase [Saccharomonospora amisosensis]NIJ09951.1 RimJ/RimL family protein N-acetyltransferase [Saccharomonospora amisosensis]
MTVNSWSERSSGSDPVLETTRMRLRRFTAADAEALAALHGDPEVMHYLDDGRPVPPTVVVERNLPAILREYDQLPDGLGCFAATEVASGGFLGWFSLRPASSVGLDGGIELGYRLRRAVWGRGYATEGARALVHHAFAALGVERLVATTMTVNTASRRVLEKAGLRLVRTFHQAWPEPIEGAEHGDVEYALTRESWQRDSRCDVQPACQRAISARNACVS